MPELSALHYLLLFAAGLAAGVVDAIAGGGGLITLPALLGLGVPAPLALGTNKLGSTFGSFSATRSYVRHGAVELRECVAGIVWTALGAFAGAFAVRRLDPDFLARAIPWLLAAIVLYLVFRPQLGETDRHHRMERAPFYACFGLALGFRDKGIDLPSMIVNDAIEKRNAAFLTRLHEAYPDTNLAEIYRNKF